MSLPMSHSPPLCVCPATLSVTRPGSGSRHCPHRGQGGLSSLPGSYFVLNFTDAAPTRLTPPFLSLPSVALSQPTRHHRPSARSLLANRLCFFPWAGCLPVASRQGLLISQVLCSCLIFPFPWAGVPVPFSYPFIAPPFPFYTLLALLHSFPADITTPVPAADQPLNPPATPPDLLPTLSNFNSSTPFTSTDRIDSTPLFPPF